MAFYFVDAPTEIYKSGRVTGARMEITTQKKITTYFKTASRTPRSFVERRENMTELDARHPFC